MDSRKRKKLLKQRRERDRRLQSFVPRPTLPLSPSMPPLHAPPSIPSGGFGLPDLSEKSGNAARSAPPRPKDVHELWWDQYKAADGPGRVAMVREKLAALKPDDPDYETYFPEAIDNLEPPLGRRAFVTFLEDLERDYPEAFFDGLDWHSLYSVGVYANDARWDQLERIVELLANRLTEITPPLPAILSQLRLCNRTVAAERLLDAVKPFIADPDLMAHARNQDMEWLLFGAYQRCLDRGASEDEIEATYRFALALGARESEEVQRDLRDVIRRLAGREPPWTREELQPGEEQGRRVYLLLVDFQRWLQRERGCAAMVADELRRLMVHAIDGTEDLQSSFLKGLRRVPFETFLARDCLGFMSLTRFHAPAIVCAMYHFYEFLGVSNLVESQVRDVSQLVCRDLWADLRKAAKTEWEAYGFLSKCFPGDRGSFFPEARGRPSQVSPN